MKNYVVCLVWVNSLAACASGGRSGVEVEPLDPVPFIQRARQAAVADLMSNFRRVHFEFDSALITLDSREALALNAEIMSRFKEIQVEVQGHCDEAGSTEYNLALGQRRADAIRKYLVTAGVHASRVTTISYGEESPLARGDGAVGLNRRAEFRITIAPGRQIRGTTAEDLALAGDRAGPTLAQSF